MSGHNKWSKIKIKKEVKMLEEVKSLQSMLEI